MTPTSRAGTPCTLGYPKMEHGFKTSRRAQNEANLRMPHHLEDTPMPSRQHAEALWVQAAYGGGAGSGSLQRQSGERWRAEV